ncbi:hypothetical protein [Bythopirellula goksoeyrii]|uniref:hypothetical protein n=1 Tax=Bythopirellula goksoeyrii TaxID=1400387 RepID=UPI0011CE8781|nr:hypothetical protein [Bythopirellula goksoeyrii]
MGTSFHAWNGSEISISGGEIGGGFNVEQGATANISGGTTGSIRAHSGSNVTLSGGAIGDYLRAESQSSFTILGGDFLIDTVPVEGLVNEGDSATIQVPFETLLSGVFADGTPFAFVVTKGFIAALEPHNTFSLVLSPLPDPGPPVIDVSTIPAPKGARNDQIIIVRDGAELGKNFTAIQGSILLIQEGGIVQNNLEVVRSTVNLTGGTIVSDFDAIAGSNVKISSGFAEEVILLDSTLTVTGGTIGHDHQGLFIGGAIDAKLNSTVNVSGGTIGDGVFIGEGSVLDVSGGTIGDFVDVFIGGTANISGGLFGERFDAFS